MWFVSLYSGIWSEQTWSLHVDLTLFGVDPRGSFPQRIDLRITQAHNSDGEWLDQWAPLEATFNKLLIHKGPRHRASEEVLFKTFAPTEVQASSIKPNKPQAFTDDNQGPKADTWSRDMAANTSSDLNTIIQDYEARTTQLEDALQVMYNNFGGVWVWRYTRRWQRRIARPMKKLFDLCFASMPWMPFPF